MYGVQEKLRDREVVWNVWDGAAVAVDFCHGAVDVGGRAGAGPLSGGRRWTDCQVGSTRTEASGSYKDWVVGVCEGKRTRRGDVTRRAPFGPCFFCSRARTGRPRAGYRADAAQLVTTFRFRHAVERKGDCHAAKRRMEIKHSTV